MNKFMTKQFEKMLYPFIRTWYYIILCERMATSSKLLVDNNDLYISFQEFFKSCLESYQKHRKNQNHNELIDDINFYLHDFNKIIDDYISKVVY